MTAYSSAQRALSAAESFSKRLAADGYDERLMREALHGVYMAKGALRTAHEVSASVDEPEPPPLPPDDEPPPIVDEPEPPDMPPLDDDEEIDAFEATVPRPQHGEIQALVRKGSWATVDGSQSGTDEFPIRAAWEALRSNPTGKVVLGLAEDFVQSKVSIGNGSSKHDLAMLRDAPVDIELVSAKPDGSPAAIENLTVSSSFTTEKTKVGLYGLDIYGTSNSFALTVQELAAYVEVDCSYQTCRSFKPGQTHTSCMHPSMGVDLFYVRGHRFGAIVKEHLWYLKGIGDCYIVESDLRGGNRTAFQTRSHPRYPYPNGINIAYATPCTYGDMYVADCFADSPGWDMPSPAGGGLMTFWCHPDHRVFVVRNRVSNARYGCVVVAAQAQNRNYYGPEGYTTKRIILQGNDFECSPQSDSPRSCVSISSTKEVHFAGGNRVKGHQRADLMIDAKFSMDMGAKPVGSVVATDEPLLAAADIRKDPRSPFDIGAFRQGLMPTAPP